MLQNGVSHRCACVKLSTKGGVSHHFGGVLTSLKMYRAIWGIAATVSQYLSAILGPEMGASILWTPGNNAFFLQEKKTHVHKIPRFRGGGSADLIFMGASFLVSRCLFCGIEVAEVSFLVSRSLFWYRDSVFCCSASISSSSWDQPVCAFLGLDIL